jgi:hypothetical protein
VIGPDLPPLDTRVSQDALLDALEQGSRKAANAIPPVHEAGALHGEQWTSLARELAIAPTLVATVLDGSPQQEREIDESGQEPEGSNGTKGDFHGRCIPVSLDRNPADRYP